MEAKIQKSERQSSPLTDRTINQAKGSIAILTMSVTLYFQGSVLQEKWNEKKKVKLQRAGSGGAHL